MILPEVLHGILAHASAASPWLILLVKATLLLALAWLVHFGLFRANPRWRTLLWRGVVVGLGLLAVWTIGLPGLELRIQSPQSVATLAAPVQPPVADAAPAIPVAAPSHQMPGPASAAMPPTVREVAVDVRPDLIKPATSLETLPSGQTVVVGIWGIGVLLLVARLGIAYLKLSTLLRSAQAVPDRIAAEVRRIAASLECRGPVRVRSSRQYAVPFLYGLRRPVLVLPERMCQPDYRSQLPAVIAHELTHVGSGDFGWNLAVQAVSILLWFHPLVWRIGSAHRAACDAVCDAVSASYLGDVQAYCRTLARVALEGAASFPVAGLAMAGSCDVRKRIAALQQRLFATSLGRRAVIGVTAVGLLLVTLLAGVRLAVAAPATQSTEDQPAALSTKITPAEDKTDVEKRRESLRAVAEEAAKTNDQPAATRYYLQLVSLPNPPLFDCRQAMRSIESGSDWRARAEVYEISAAVMKAIISAPPESFTRPSPPQQPRAVTDYGSTVEVQMDLDGLWTANCRGTVKSWLQRIKRKQQEMKHERFDILYRLAQLYRDWLGEPKKVVGVLRESLADVPFFTMPLEKLISTEWPLKRRDPQFWAELGVRLPAARELAAALAAAGDIDAAIDMQNRAVLAEYSWAHIPHREIEKLLWLLQQRPLRSPLPLVACLSILSPERPSIEFDLDALPATKTEYKLWQLSLAARPGFAFDSLELGADMESKGGYVSVPCQTLRSGKATTLGSVGWHNDQRKGRELRTSTFSIPDGTGVIHFNKSWLPGTDPDDVTVHRITVKATFREALPYAGPSPFAAEARVVDGSRIAELQVHMQPEQAGAEATTTSLADAVQAINQQAAKLPEARGLEPLTEDEVVKSIERFVREKPFDKQQELKGIAETRRLPKDFVLRQFVRYNDGTAVEHGWWVRLMRNDVSFSVSIRQQPLFRRPYTQRERLFQDEFRREGAMLLLNRHVAYFTDDPKVGVVQQFSATQAERLADAVKKAIADNNADDLLKLYCWEKVDEKTRTEVRAEAEHLAKRRLSSVSVSPKRFAGKLLQWQGFKNFDSNLSVLGYITLEFADGDGPKSVALEFGDTPDGARLVNYIVTKDDGPRMVGKPLPGRISEHGFPLVPLPDGSLEMYSAIEAPDALPALQNANFELWKLPKTQ